MSPVLAWLLIQQRYRTALAAVFLAGITDWLDGIAARAINAKSTVGAYLDPLADKAMLVTLFLSLGVTRQIPAWLIWLVMGRDAVILGGSAALRYVYGYKRFMPTMWGKVSTFFQIATVLAVLLSASFDAPPLILLKNIGIWSTALFTSISGVQYCVRGIKMTVQARKSLAAGSTHT